MRVVAGRPDPIAQTPMMNAFIRYVALNPYWNSPPDITARRLAPNILKGGRAYLNEKGYELMSDWSENARVLDPMSVNWNAGRRRPGPGPPAAEARTGQLDGRDEVHVPQQAGDLAPRHAGEGEDRGGRPAAEQRLRPARGRAALRALAVQRPGAEAQGRAAEQKVPLPSPVPIYITYLTAVPSGTSIIYFDDFYGKDRAAAQQDRKHLLARLAIGRRTKA